MKQYTIKVYNQAGTTFLGVLTDTVDYRFTKTINGGLGSLIMQLPRRLDSYNSDGLLTLSNEIQVWVQDGDAPAGTKIYSGYIDGVIASNTGGAESIIVQVLGYVTRLGFSALVSGSSMSIDFSADDPAEHFKDIIDFYRADVANERINYAVGTVEIAGFDVSKQMNRVMCMEAIDEIRAISGADWWWFVDANNVAYFKSKPTTPTHIFTFDKEVSAISTSYDMTDVSNNFNLYNSLQPDDPNYINELYANSASEALYFKRYQLQTDGRMTDPDSVDKLGEAYINAFKNPNTSTVITIKDNNYGDGYNIESINPGDTCTIRNILPDNPLEDNMLITRVDYQPEYVTVFLQDLRELVSRNLNDLRKQIDQINNGDAIGDFTSTAV